MDAIEQRSNGAALDNVARTAKSASRDEDVVMMDRDTIPAVPVIPRVHKDVQGSVQHEIDAEELNRTIERADHKIEVKAFLEDLPQTAVTRSPRQAENYATVINTDSQQMAMSLVSQDSMLVPIDSKESDSARLPLQAGSDASIQPGQVNAGPADAATLQAHRPRSEGRDSSDIEMDTKESLTPTRLKTQSSNQNDLVELEPTITGVMSAHDATLTHSPTSKQDSSTEKPTFQSFDDLNADQLPDYESSSTGSNAGQPAPEPPTSTYEDALPSEPKPKLSATSAVPGELVQGTPPRTSPASIWGSPIQNAFHTEDSVRAVPMVEVIAVEAHTSVATDMPIKSIEPLSPSKEICLDMQEMPPPRSSSGTPGVTIKTDVPLASTPRRATPIPDIPNTYIANANFGNPFIDSRSNGPVFDPSLALYSNNIAPPRVTPPEFTTYASSEQSVFSSSVAPRKPSFAPMIDYSGGMRRRVVSGGSVSSQTSQSSQSTVTHNNTIPGLGFWSPTSPKSMGSSVPFPSTTSSRVAPGEPVAMLDVMATADGDNLSVGGSLNAWGESAATSVVSEEE